MAGPNVGGGSSSLRPCESYSGVSKFLAWSNGAPRHIRGRCAYALAVDASYYSAVDSVGEDPGGFNAPQGYITAVAAQAVIVVNSDDRSIGRAGCVFVRTADVLSCVIGALPGQHIDKGAELGFFQYGGSTCCVMFEPGAIRDLIPQVPFDDKASRVEVNMRIAMAR
ncbi:Phosphatidylserine decarboxylase proenzyme (plasmid) [Burkholderia sp. AD24]|nr:Phosphatidylserine decarboxylase proenzyme [Burkholderia sp. AD24]